jgi:hypothetical protein
MLTETNAASTMTIGQRAAMGRRARSSAWCRTTSRQTRRSPTTWARTRTIDKTSRSQLEEEFDLEIPDRDGQQLLTVRQIVDYIERSSRRKKFTRLQPSRD